MATNIYTTWPSGQTLTGQTLSDSTGSGYYNVVNSGSSYYGTVNSQTYPAPTPSTWYSSASVLPSHEIDPDLKTFLQLAGVSCDVQAAWLSQEAKWTIVLRHEDRHQMTANTHEENPDEFIRAMASFYLTSHFLKAKP